MLKCGVLEYEISRIFYNYRVGNLTSDNSNSNDYLVIRSMYQKILHRNPDYTEVYPHIAEIRKTSRKAVIKSILFSEESIKKNIVPPHSVFISAIDLSLLPKRDFISQLYIKILNRTGSDTELSAWKSKLNVLPKLLIIFFFMKSLEYKENSNIIVFSNFTNAIYFKIVSTQIRTYKFYKRVRRFIYRKIKGVLSR